MKSILQGFSRPVFLAITLLFGAFIGLSALSMAPKPAQAWGGCPCKFEIENNCDCVGKKIAKFLLGNENGTGTSENVYDGDKTTTFGSLTEYFEKVWWPRYLRTEQLVATEDAGAESINIAHRGAIADGENNAQTVARQQDFTTQFQDEQMGAADAICEHLTLSQSSAALEAHVYAGMAELSQMALSSRVGDPNAPGPNASRGPMTYPASAVAETISVGTCDPNGNNGKSQLFCQGGAIPNAHTNANTLFGQTTLNVNGTDTINSLTFANMYLDRLFDRRFTNISPERLSPPLHRAVNDAIMMQDSYRAAISAFMFPFNRTMSENNPMPNAEAEKYAREALTRAGLDQNLTRRVLGEGGLSKAGMNKAIDGIITKDVTNLMTQGVKDPASISRLILMQSNATTAVLQDIRELLRETNMLIGALGRVSSDDLYKEAEKLTQDANTGR